MKNILDKTVKGTFQGWSLVPKEEPVITLGIDPSEAPYDSTTWYARNILQKYGIVREENPYTKTWVVWVQAFTMEAARRQLWRYAQVREISPKGWDTRHRGYKIEIIRYLLED